MGKVKTKDSAIETARRVLDTESSAVRSLIDKLDDNFSRAVDIIYDATGKVVVTGMGKSGIICQKIASTLASTGTPSFFLHPAEGVHGDLGMIMKNDVLLALSNSGETDELTKIIPVTRRMGIKLIAMTGRMGSALARYGDVVLDVGVAAEACPLGLSPTASTTAALAMGDALAVALLERRGFRAEDFATLHPAGSLGRRLMKVDDIMHRGPAVPAVASGTSMKDALLEMTSKRLGLTGVFDGPRLIGAITDGDLRRALEAGGDILARRVDDLMNTGPKTIRAGALAEAALKLMEDHAITSLFVTAEDSGEIVGVIHMHDLVRAGVI